MSVALELIQTVKRNGGQLRIEGEQLVIAPRDAAIPILEKLREYKAEILQLLERQQFADEPSSMVRQVPDAWAEDVATWALDRCVCREDYEDSGGIGALLLDCAEWCNAHNSVPPTRAVLVELLRSAGLEVKDGLVRGLILRNDLELSVYE